jgi:hypothetical protein
VCRLSCKEQHRRASVWLSSGFFICRVTTVTVDAGDFAAGHARMCPEMVENLLEPALTRKCCRACSALVIDVVLLNLDPIVTEEASKRVGPSKVVPGRDWELKAWFAVIGRHVKKWVILQSTLNGCQEDGCLPRSGWVQSSEMGQSGPFPTSCQRSRWRRHQHDGSFEFHLGDLRHGGGRI